MSQKELPQWHADQIEWNILLGARTEYSRGDYQVDRAFDVAVDAEDPYEPAPGMDEARLVDDCFDHMEYRAGVFSLGYAFELDEDVISKRDGAETDSQLVYRFLLACSRTELSKSLSLHFSELCKLALQRLLGPRASVWNVDAGSADRKALGGSTRKVAVSLAHHLGATVHQANLDDLPDAGGDGGSDLVATLGFDDKASGSLCLLGQCAASSDTGYWRDKLYQPTRFKSLYHWSAGQPVLAAFIPVVYRKANGTWLDNINVVELLFDRIRILKALDVENNPLDAEFRLSLEQAIALAISKRTNKSAAKKATKKPPRNAVKKAPVKKHARAAAGKAA